MVPQAYYPILLGITQLYARFCQLSIARRLLASCVETTLNKVMRLFSLVRVAARAAACHGFD